MVYLDARMIESSGIGTYIKNLSSKTNIYDFYLGVHSTLIKYFPEDKLIEYNSNIYGIKEQINFPYNRVGRRNILHCPHYNIPVFYSGKLVVTIHDIIHILFPEYLPNRLAWYYSKFMIGLATKKANKIITDSQNTKNDLIKYFNISSKKIIVIHIGVNSNFRIVNKNCYKYLYNKYKIEQCKKIILYVGNKKPHKNLETLLKAFYKSKLKKNSLLIFVGRDFDNYKNLNILSRKLKLDDYIIHTGTITDEELVYFYNLADLFVFPSLYEGFGLPPLEAMACGTPVVSSNTSSMPEILGDAAYFVNPKSVDELKNAIDEVLDNDELRDKLIKKGLERVKLFTWDKCINRTIKIFNRLSKEE